MALNSSVFLARTSLALNETGGSMAIIARSWNKWFGTMSRNAPVSRKTAAGLDAHRLRHGDLHVATYSRFQSGSKMPLAKRSTSMFWTVSLPRK